jgi:CRP-like cAMP-binding protein
VSARNDHSRGLGDDQLNLLRRAGQRRTYQPGRPLFKQGDRSEFAVIIEEGQVDVVRRAANGVATVLTNRGAGDLIGEFGCIDRAPRSASVIAVTRVTAFVIPAAELRQILREQSRMLFALLAITIRRVRESDRLRLEFGGDSGVERVFRKLLTLADQTEETGHGTERSVRLRITGAELADAAGVSRSTVVRAYDKLRKRGLISTGQGLVEILDLDQLRAFVSGDRS